MFYRLVANHVAAALLLVSIVPPVQADTNWVLSPGQSGDWSNPANWTNGVPTSSINAVIANGGTATVTQSGAACDLLTVNNSSTLVVSSGSLSVGAVNSTSWTIDGFSGVQLTGGSLSAISSSNNAYVGYSDGGSFAQSGGSNQASGLYLGYNSGASGAYGLSGSGSMSASSLYLGYNAGASGAYSLSGSGVVVASNNYVGYSGVGSFTQSAGTVTKNIYIGYNVLDLGYNPSGTGTYNLSGTGQLSASIQQVGCSGTGIFNQSGGTNTVAYYTGNSYYLYLGYNPGSSGTYNLSGGQLSAMQEYVGYDAAATALLQQTGGSNTTSFISIGAGGRLVLAGGTLSLTSGGCGGISCQGSIDCSNSQAALFGGSDNIIDFSRANLTNVGGMTVSVGPHSLFTVPAGFDPASAFGSFTCDVTSIVHAAGSPVVIAAGQSIAGQGTINDIVNCQGTLTTYNWPLNLNAGLSLSGAGNMNLGSSGTVTVNGTSSGMTGGTLSGNCDICIGCGGSGVFTHSGGLCHSDSIYLGYSAGDSGKYDLNGTGSEVAATEYVGYSGAGDFVQTGGSASVSALYIGYNSGSSGTYELGNAYLLVPIEYIGYGGAGTVTQSGGTNSSSDPVGICLGYNAHGRGTYNLSGGMCTVAFMRIGVSGIGTFNQSGGTVSMLQSGYNNALYIGNGTGTGTYNLSGAGQLLMASTGIEYVGYSGAGTFSQSGGTNTAIAVTLAYGTGSSGEYDLNAGALVLKSLSAGSGTAVFNFGGGTMNVAGAFSTAVPMTLTGIGGNATIDTAGYAVTLSGQVSGSGGLNKVGASVLVLSGANDYTGNTAVYAGVLSLAQPDLYGGSNVSVARNAVLNLTYSDIDTVRSLTLGGVQEPPGIYNSTNSGGYIIGIGSIQVVPEPSTLILLGISAIGLFIYVWRWRRRGR
jgi:autotransporter-associated beta strand protein